MLIDFHTHSFPEKIAARTIDILESNTERVEGKRSRACTDGTVKGLLKSMSEYGVDISVVMPIATNPKQADTINRVAQETNAIDGLYSFGSLHPIQEDWERVIEDIYARGLKGVKLHPEYQQFYIDSPESIRVLKKCEELGLLVTLHTGRDIGIEPPVHCMPERLRRVLDYELSGKNIIAAHMGGWRAWDEVERYLVGTPILLDTAYVSRDMDKDRFERIVKQHGSDKVLFATDSPWECPSETVEYIESLNLTAAEKADIYYRNASKLLGIEERD